MKIEKNLYLLAFLFLLSGCTFFDFSDNSEPEPELEPEVPTLTEPTMEGKHTLSFLLDGEV